MESVVSVNRGYRHTIPTGKEPVMFLPAVAQVETILHLHSTVLPKQGERSIRALKTLRE